MKLDTSTMLVMSVIFGMLSTYVATKKNKNPYIGFFFGLFFGILGLLAVYFLLPEQKEQQEEKREPTINTPPPPPEEECWYYLDSDKKAQGPFTMTVLKSKNLPQKTYIWKPGMADWMKME